jgi:hypothetical protein
VITQLYKVIVLTVLRMDRRFSLESLADGELPYRLKSEGERRIAEFLDKNSIRYHYEAGVLLYHPRGKLRIWYPDFHLPEFGVYIEYYGLYGRQNYDRGIKAKQSAYAKTGLKVIPVYPWTFNGDWKGYIMKELRDRSIQSYRNIMDKPYWRQGGGMHHQSRVSHGQRIHYRGFKKGY